MMQTARTSVQISGHQPPKVAVPKEVIDSIMLTLTP
jgi:hypothetical protein